MWLMWLMWLFCNFASDFLIAVPGTPRNPVDNATYFNANTWVVGRNESQRTSEEVLQNLKSLHVQAYFEEVKITLLPLVLPPEPEAGLGKKTVDNIRLNFPVITEFEWKRFQEAAPVQADGFLVKN